jgi:hypothetical protein
MASPIRVTFSGLVRVSETPSKSKKGKRENELQKTMLSSSVTIEISKLNGRPGLNFHIP